MVRVIYAWSVAVIIQIVVFIVLMPITLIFKRTPTVKKIVYGFVNWWAKATLRAGKVAIKMHSKDLNELHGPYLIMTNHQSFGDILVLIAILPFGIGFLTRKEFYRIPIFSYWLRAIGCVKIDREDREKAIAALDQAALVASQKDSLVIFPEGTRGVDGKLGPFKKGGFVLAIQSGVPILPISISETRLIMPKGKYSFKPGTVNVKMHESIETTSYSLDEKEKLMDKVQLVIESGVEELRSIASNG